MGGAESDVALSVQSAPPGGRRQCLPLTARLLTPEGIIEVKDLHAGIELLSLGGEKVLVEASCVLPGDRLRDFVEVEVEKGGILKATTDHRLEACMDGYGFHAVCMGDLREGMW